MKCSLPLSLPLVIQWLSPLVVLVVPSYSVLLILQTTYHIVPIESKPTTTQSSPIPIPTTTTISSTSISSISPPTTTTKTRHQQPSLTNRIQRFVQLGRTNAKVQQTTKQQGSNDAAARKKCRTKIVVRLPDSYSAWDHLYGSGSGTTGDDLMVEYNHGEVGITDPSIQFRREKTTNRLSTTTPPPQNNDDDERIDKIVVVDSSSDNPGDDWWRIDKQIVVVDSSSDNNPAVEPKNNKPNNDSYGDWWPSSSFGSNTYPVPPLPPPQSTMHNIRKQTNNGGWRIKRYVRRVGIGDECYQRVRNAALDWEFHTDGEGDHHRRRRRTATTNGTEEEGDGSTNSDHNNNNNNDDDRGRNAMGIVQAIQPPPPYHQSPNGSSNSSRRNDPFKPLPSNTNTNVVQLWSTPGKRKLATYAEYKLPFLPIGTNNRKITTNDNNATTHSSTRRSTTPFLPILRIPSYRLPAALYVLNPVAVVYDILDQRGPGTTYTSTAYGTLGGHWLRGEERVTVAMRDWEENDDGGGVVSSSSSSSTTTTRHGGGGYVDVEILSYSRPSNSVMGRLVWPLIGKMQNAFFLNQMDFLEYTAAAAADQE